MRIDPFWRAVIELLVFVTLLFIGCRGYSDAVSNRHMSEKAEAERDSCRLQAGWYYDFDTLELRPPQWWGGRAGSEPHPW